MQNRPEKCLMPFLIENKTFLTLETKIKVNPQILDISGKIRQDFLERKTAFLDFINKAIKKSKQWDFSKGVGPLVKDLKIFHVIIYSK